MASVKSYTGYRDKLESFIDKREEDFNNLSIKINSGALGLSLTLLSIFIDFRQIDYNWLILLPLAVGWLCLIGSLVLNLSYSLIANNDARKTIEEIGTAIRKSGKEDEFDDDEVRKNIHGCNKKARNIFIAMIALTISGIFSILLFICLYMNCTERQIEDKKTECCCIESKSCEK